MRLNVLKIRLIEIQVVFLMKEARGKLNCSTTIFIQTSARFPNLNRQLETFSTIVQ